MNELRASGADLRSERLRFLGRKIAAFHRGQLQPQRLQPLRQVLGKRAGRHRVESFLDGLKANGPGGKVRAVRVGGKDGWQLGEHVTRVMAATP
jgi:hypothetical protein